MTRHILNIPETLWDKFLDVAALGVLGSSVLLLHFGLPETVVEQLTFYLESPSFLTAWTSSFVHFSDQHALANVAVFVLAGSIGWFLFYTIDRSCLFWGVTGVVFLAVPIVSTYGTWMVVSASAVFNEEVIVEGASRGFSDVASAMVGVALAGVGLWLGKEHGPTVGYDTLAVLLGGTFVGLAIASGRNPVLFGVGFALLLVLVGYRQWASGALDVVSRPDLVGENLQTVSVLLFGIIGVVMVWGLFPLNPVGDGRVVNVFAHAIGFGFGLLAPVVMVFK